MNQVEQKIVSDRWSINETKEVIGFTFLPQSEVRRDRCEFHKLNILNHCILILTYLKIAHNQIPSWKVYNHRISHFVMIPSFAMKDHLDRLIMTVGKGIRSWRFESIDVDRLLIANFLNHGSLELPTAFDSYYNVINSFYRAFVRVSFWCCSKVDKTTSVRYFKDMFEPLHSYFPKAKYREYVKGVFRDHYLF